MRKQFVVIGLGRFGSALCRELDMLGHEVLAIDSNDDKINTMLPYSTNAVVANATDENVLKSLGIRNFDVAIVGIGEDMQSSIHCTLLLKEMGLKVWVKAQNSYHQKILEKIGADRVIQPELDMGIRVAHKLDSENIIDYIELSKDYSIVELIATAKIDQRSIIELKVRAKYGCTILAIKRGEDINISPLPEDIICRGDILVLVGSNIDIKRFEEKAM
ncbi:potassium channel family protein [Fredinandcohnia sp. 179-A 10B2 NHS]|uniref:potassium channel family protein n=1 Tax=Fredinandcohnia sp. 179-A 10B2 NHS TaxID=3235176 RepID=UPI0039A12BA5